MEELEVDAAPTVEELEDEKKENVFPELDDKDRYIIHLLEEIEFLRSLVRPGEVRPTKKRAAPTKPMEPIQKVKTWNSVAARMREAEGKNRKQVKEIINAGKKPSPSPGPSVP